MHVSVTALGARADRAKAAARDIVNYLQSTKANDLTRNGSLSTDRPQLGAATSPGSYYSDSASVAGRWRGAGAKELGDTVDPAALARLLLGQDPITGEQLVNAAGSSGRSRNRPTGLPPGDPDELITLPAAAKAIGVDVSYLRRLARQQSPPAQPPAPSPGRPNPPPTSPNAPPASQNPPPGPDRSPPADRSSARLEATKVDGRWMVTRAEVERFAAARNPPQVVMAYDITFSAPKSVSIVWATGDQATKQLMTEAFEAGVARGVDYLESHAIFVGRQHTTRPGTMTAASYRHETNRELEPQLHEHVVIANMATDVHGQTRALDGRHLFEHATTAGHLAEAEMQNYCNRRGIAWTDTRRGIADVQSVPPEAIKAMSTRREQILNLTAELGTHSAHARQTAAVATRAPRTTAVDPVDLQHQWRTRLAEHGFGPEELIAATTARPAPLWTPADSKRLDHHLAGPQGVTEQSAVFNRRDVIQAIVDHTGGRLNADEIEAHTDRWLHTNTVIPLTQPDAPIHEQTLYTTPVMVDIENRIAASYQQGHHTGSGLAPSDAVDTAITNWEGATGHQLGADQAAMVQAICTSGDRFQAVVGPAGSGKTAAIEVAARAWEASGHQVIGAAVNGTAAEVIQRSTGIESRTVAELLTRLDLTNETILTPDTILVVDEASTLGNRHHARLIRHVEDAGAVMRTIGDPAQHGAVEAGGMWTHLVEQHPDRTPALTENRRQASDDMTDIRLANADYRAGRIAEAINRLDTNDRIVTAPNSGELLDQLAVDWHLDQRISPQSTSRMIAEHHRERRALNQRAQILLRADGTITGHGIEIGDATFHIGDHVIARAANRGLHPDDDPKGYVRNGTTGTITGITGPASQENLVVDFEHRGAIQVPRDWLETEIRPGITGGLAPAYAVTSHAAQGDTYQSGRMVATDTASPEAVYVGLTRGRHDTRVYTVRNEPHTIETDPHLPRINDPRNPVEALSDQLTKQRPTELATLTEPEINDILQLSRLPLADLDTIDNPQAAAAKRIVETRVAHQARNEPDPAVVAHLGRRPDTNADQWDNAVSAIAVYRERWNDPQPLPTAPTPNSARQLEDHTQLRAVVVSRRSEMLTSVPTADLAARRHALIQTAHETTSEHIPLLRHDLQKATALQTEARAHRRTAQQAHRQARSGRQGRRSPDHIETTRRQLEAATTTESIATQHVDQLDTRLDQATAGTTSTTQIKDEVTAIDNALQPRIKEAVDNPSPYITDTIGPRPTDDDQPWQRQARAIETYRHTTLGLEPNHGPLNATSPAIGPRPTDPLRERGWLAATNLVGNTHIQPSRIGR